MNLYKLAGFLVLIWLPLASFKLCNPSQLGNLLLNKKNTATIEHKDTNLIQNITEKMEKVLFPKLNSKLMLSIKESYTNSIYATICANVSLKENDKNLGNEENLIVAYKLKTSVKKDLSALIKNSFVKKKSATKFKRHVRRFLTNPDTKVDKIKNMEISEEIGSNSFKDNEEEEEFENSDNRNNTEMGSFLGATCELTCDQKLLHVFCEPTSKVCECEDKYPVQLDAYIGCEKPKQLGDQCFYAETCTFFDPNAMCMQINHNAICHCKPGFHAVALRKGVKRMFCSEDVAVVSADLSTLLGIATGIAVLTGLICFVLRLFSGNRYPSTRHYADSNIAPPLLLSSDNQWINGIPLTVHGRPPSRSSCQRSTMNLTQYSRNKGVLVPASRAGAARAAAILLIPCHLQASRHSEAINSSNADDNDVRPNDAEQTSRLGSRRQSFSSVQSGTSSQKSMSYSARRFEQENQQREQRAAIKAAKEEAAKSISTFTPSPLSTNGIMPFSKNAEENPIWANSEDSPQELELPPFSVSQGMTTLISSPK